MDNLTKLIESTEILNEAQLKQQSEGILFAPKELPSYEPKRDLDPLPFSSPRQEVIIKQPLPDIKPSVEEIPANKPSDQKVREMTFEEPFSIDYPVASFLKQPQDLFTNPNPSRSFEDSKPSVFDLQRSFNSYSGIAPLEEEKFPATAGGKTEDFSTVKTAFYADDTYEMTPRPVMRQTFDEFVPTSERNLFQTDQAEHPRAFIHDHAVNVPAETASQQLRASLEDPKQFVSNPLPQNVWFKCRIIRSRAGLFNLGAKFTLYTEEAKELLSAKRVASSIRSYYRIAFSKDDLTEKGLVARLNSNYLGSVFTLFDQGLSPDAKGVSEDNLREELVSVAYVSYIAGSQPNRTLMSKEDNCPPSHRELNWTALRMEA
mmetsp:Transcript_13572/g.25613  ORF Transcript_13572/g.25613 Transcript_13572/m.25613 type:complete len:374 (-) Transcript_13572:1205-2326(-)